MKSWKYSLLVIAVLLAALNFVPVHPIPLPDISTKPSFDSFYDPSLAESITSIDQLENYLDNQATTDSGPETLTYWNNAATVLRHRFFHGYSTYGMNENWISSLLGSSSGESGLQFHAIVLPNDIMKYPMAACSQQGIVLQTLFQKKGIQYKTVQFNHHYAVTAEIEGKWYFFDTNIEPMFPNGIRPTIDQLQDKEYLRGIYPQFTPEKVDYVLGKPNLGAKNPTLAPNMSFFHRVTWVLSKFAWLPLFLLFLFLYRRRNVY